MRFLLRRGHYAKEVPLPHFKIEICFDVTTEVNKEEKNGILEKQEGLETTCKVVKMKMSL